MWQPCIFKCGAIEDHLPYALSFCPLCADTEELIAECKEEMFLALLVRRSCSYRWFLNAGRSVGNVGLTWWWDLGGCRRTRRTG